MAEKFIEEQSVAIISHPTMFEGVLLYRVPGGISNFYFNDEGFL